MSAEFGRRSIVMDLRCLQDPNYAGRGIGRHALSMLRHAPRGCHIAGLIDPALPPLRPEVREAVRTVHVNAYAASPAARVSPPAACFVTMSPMTHDPLFTARLLSDPSLLRVAVVHDFIPRRMPERYLPSPAERLAYASALRWLARCDLYLPNSRSSADDLKALLKVPESAIAVTGCPLDHAFEAAAGIAQDLPATHLLVVAGADPRKNPDVVIRAHARSPAMQQGRGVPLVVAGSYSAQDSGHFRALAVAAGGRADLVGVPGHLSDDALLELYGNAIALICPSEDEGFSIPVIEGMAAGLPCLVSDIPAHAELVTDPDCRFPATDEASLRPKLERLVADDGWRAAILARQAVVWPRFSANVVAARFWDAISERLRGVPPAVLRGRRPRVAILSPIQPDRSGVADYTTATCVELGRLVDLHVFSETERPVAIENVAAIRPLSELPHIKADFERIVSVAGNSEFHLRIFEMLRRYGGACIAHDARLAGFYRTLFGKDRALSVASKELGRPVSEAELDGWLGDEAKLPTLFLGEIAESATPIIVHSSVTAGLIRELYNVSAAHLPFSIQRPIAAEELTKSSRAAARARLCLDDNEIAIASFGWVQLSKAPEECIWALEVLRRWGIPASLHFVGELVPHPRTAGLRTVIAELGLEPYVRFNHEYVSQQTYRDYLVGADLGVQLRTHGLGSVSGALLDCATAGLPSVTNESLGAAVDVPEYIRCIPDALSPLLLAEQLAGLLEAGLAATRPEPARRAFVERRSMAAYSRALCETLGLESPTMASVPHILPAA